MDWLVVNSHTEMTSASAAMRRAVASALATAATETPHPQSVTRLGPWWGPIRLPNKTMRTMVGAVSCQMALMRAQGMRADSKARCTSTNIAAMSATLCMASSMATPQAAITSLVRGSSR